MHRRHAPADGKALCREPRCAARGIRADTKDGYCQECSDLAREYAAEARAESIREEWALENWR